jgi:hypothetical protein
MSKRSRRTDTDFACRHKDSFAESKEVTPSCADSTRSAALRCVQAEPCRYLRRGPFYTLMTSVSEFRYFFDEEDRYVSQDHGCF